MSLIPSHRHSPRDLERWARLVDLAQIHARLSAYRKRVDHAGLAVLSFAGAPCYAGVSWGKDSVVLAHLVVRYAPRVPLVWVRVEPDFNPDCPLVRDAFLAAHPGALYDEIAVERSDAKAVVHGTLELGMRTAQARYGARYMSGVRGDESGQRMRRMRAFGESTERTCAPLGWWTAMDVFAYLIERHLPIHPAYACLMDGLLDPARVRVGPLGGHRAEGRPGDGHGRLEWEQRYYGDAIPH